MKGKKTGGRTKGTPNKVTREMKVIAYEMTIGNQAYMAALQKRLKSGKAHPSVETFVLAHAVGKPAETVNLNARELPPLMVIDELSDADIAAIHDAHADDA
jgi:hypothetical protein